MFKNGSRFILNSNFPGRAFQLFRNQEHNFIQSSISDILLSIYKYMEFGMLHTQLVLFPALIGGIHGLRSLLHCGLMAFCTFTSQSSFEDTCSPVQFQQSSYQVHVSGSSPGILLSKTGQSRGCQCFTREDKMRGIFRLFIVQMVTINFTKFILHQTNSFKFSRCPTKIMALTY